MINSQNLLNNQSVFSGIPPSIKSKSIVAKFLFGTDYGIQVLIFCYLQVALNQNCTFMSLFSLMPGL